MASEIELAYIAGFFDGEGCVNLKVLTKKSGRQKGQIYSEMTIEISNNDLSVLNVIYHIFGGRITKRYDFNHPHTLRMESKKASDFLKSVYPYLVTKKEQARIGIEFQSLIGWSGKKVPKENMDKRIDLVSSIKEVRRKINEFKGMKFRIGMIFQLRVRAGLKYPLALHEIRGSVPIKGD